MFKRIALFIEKRGYRERLLNDETIADLHGWNAHNYRGEGLADFFNAVERRSFSINRYEEQLRAIAERNGIIGRMADGTWSAGRGGVLAVSQESYPALRRLLITHEAMHGVFYEERRFREGVRRYWTSSLNERERRFWRETFRWMSYAPEDEYLMYNEFQAYLLQREEAVTRWYFRTRIADQVRGSGGRSEPVDTFLGAHPTTFVDAADAMNRLLFETAGMVGGDPYCVHALDVEG